MFKKKNSFIWPTYLITIVDDEQVGCEQHRQGDDVPVKDARDERKRTRARGVDQVVGEVGGGTGGGAS
jgi:hypothetical protein